MTCALITGLTGFVSSHLCDYLLANTDWLIYGTYRWSDDLSNIEHLMPQINAADSRVRLVPMELRDASSIREAVHHAEPDYVFHLAAQSFPRSSFDAACDTYDTNVCGTERLLDAIRATWRKPWPWVHV